MFSAVIDNEEHFLVYNSASGSFMRVNENIYKVLSLARGNGEVDMSSLSSETVEYLKKARIIGCRFDDDAYVRQCEMDR